MAGVVSAAAPQSGSYVLETTHAEVLFGVSHLGFSTYYGQFPGATGTLKLDGDHPQASQLDVSVPVAGVMTASAKLNGELASPMWLDAGKYPMMTFHSTQIAMTGPMSADVIGDLTFHGVTKAVVLKATFTQAGPHPMNHKYTLGFEVTGRINRSDFGMATFSPMIGNDVSLIISAPFEKAS